MESTRGPLVVIVGPTASGKTHLAHIIADKFGGEIISADSRTLYRGLDIGTDKPSLKDRHGTTYHLIDIADPDQPINVSQYKDLANKEIEAINAMGKLPILVGGSGLYINAVIYDYKFASAPSGSQRSQLDPLSVNELQDRLRSLNIALPENSRNKRYLIRQIETGGVRPDNLKLRKNTLLIGITKTNAELKKAIVERVDAMFSSGLRQEAKHLIDKYGKESSVLDTIAYKEFLELGFDEDDEMIKELIVKHTYDLAKRQKTWLKRNQNIVWVENDKEAVQLVQKNIKI